MTSKVRTTRGTSKVRTSSTRSKRLDERSIFSISRDDDRTRTFPRFASMLRANGIPDVERASTVYVGHFGLSVPKRYELRTSKLVFGS